MNVVILGCGSRGRTYARYCEENNLTIVGAVDPLPDRLERFGKEFNLLSDKLHLDWQKTLAETCDAPEAIRPVAMLNCTPDLEHYKTTIAALQRGLHILLEKPMSPIESECHEMVKLAREKNRVLMVCHVLRYAPFFEKLRELIDAKDIGRVINIVLTENVAYWHFAHSFVRGIFRNETISSPFILAKSCHDLDMLVYLTGKRCLSVMSEGNLNYYRSENAPEGAPEYCLDGCPHETTCPHFAPRTYLKPITHVGWPQDVVSTDTSYSARYQAIKDGQYGRCVFRCDNDANDCQSSLFVMEDGLLATFTMTGFSSENTRTIRIFGTKGDIRGHLDKGVIEVHNFLDDTQQVYETSAATTISGHGGGDARLLADFASVLNGNKNAGDVRTSAQISLQSHLMAFAAEQSRKTGVRVSVDA